MSKQRKDVGFEGLWSWSLEAFLITLGIMAFFALLLLLTFFLWPWPLH